ncbi:MAG: hypothetical protein JWP87_6332 [Labilithrix sp.]|nr:hypothetical protein [Labilithrix sp.]
MNDASMRSMRGTRAIDDGHVPCSAVASMLRIPAATGLFVLLAALSTLTACSTTATAVRDTAAQELACPRSSIRLEHVDRRIYRATGCGGSVEVACYDPQESTGAQKGWADPLTAGKRSRCETLGTRPTLTSSVATRVAATRGGFDRELAAKLLAASADRARTTCARRGGPTGPGHARITFAPDGSMASVDVEAPFAGTEVGACVAEELSRVSLPPFEGSAVTLGKHFEIPDAKPVAGTTEL